MKNLNVCGFAVLYLICNTGASSSGRHKLVIDNDAGADDAMAIFMAVLYEKHFDGQSRWKWLYQRIYAEFSYSPQLVALTTGNGNTGEDNVYRNNQRILRVANRQDIPIYRGSTSSLVTTPVTNAYYGADGLGDAEEEDAGLAPARDTHAVLALLELSKQYEGELVVVTIGTLTNLALAIKLDAGFLSRCAHVYVGASHIHSEAETEPEFNAQMDAEAYHVVAQHATPDKFTIFPFSQTKQYLNFTKEWREKELGTIDTDYIRALNLYERVSLQKSEFWQLLDPATVAVCLRPSIVSEYKYARNGIILCGARRGCNTNEFVRKEDANVRLVYAVHKQRYQQLLLDVFNKK